MEVLNNKDQTLTFKLKEFDSDSLTEVKIFNDDNDDKLFEVGYELDCPVFIRVKYDSDLNEDYLFSVCVEEIILDARELYAIPFLQEYDILQCERISICNKDDLFVCIEEGKVKGILIYNIELYGLQALIDCFYQKRN